MCSENIGSESECGSRRGGETVIDVTEVVLVDIPF